MAVKMNLRIKTKNYAADPEKGILTKSISKPNGFATAMPTALELKYSNFKTSKVWNSDWQLQRSFVAHSSMIIQIKALKDTNKRIIIFSYCTGLVDEKIIEI